MNRTDSAANRAVSDASIGLLFEHLVVEQQRQRWVLVGDGDPHLGQLRRPVRHPSGITWRPMSFEYGMPNEWSNPWRVGRNSGWSPQCHLPTCWVA
ncbi:MAG: hypothetical protein R2697_20420 [Ilumatobacteraceae bacterium]